MGELEQSRHREDEGWLQRSHIADDVTMHTNRGRKSDSAATDDERHDNYGKLAEMRQWLNGQVPSVVGDSIGSQHDMELAERPADALWCTR